MTSNKSKTLFNNWMSSFSKSLKYENRSRIIFKRSQINTVLVVEIFFCDILTVSSCHLTTIWRPWFDFHCSQGTNFPSPEKVPQQRFPPFILDPEFLTALIFVFVVHLISSSSIAANGENIYSPQIPQRLAQGTEDFHFQ